MNIAVSWQQVITIGITQAISAISTFYTLRTLGMLHNGELVKKVVKKDEDKNEHKDSNQTS